MTQSLTKSCPHCKATIDSAAKKCQHCQTDLRSWFLRHPVWTCILVIVIVPIIASTVSDTKKVHNNTAQITSAPQTASGTLSTDEIKTIGSQATANANDIAKRTLDTLSITSVKIVENVIGTPELYVTVKNNGTKTADAFTFAVDLYNNFDEQLGEWNRRDNEPFLGISQATIKPGTIYQDRFNLAVYDQATKAKNLRIIKVHFTDGTGAELSGY